MVEDDGQKETEDKHFQRVFFYYYWDFGEQRLLSQDAYQVYNCKELKILNDGVSQKDRKCPHYSWIELYSRCLHKYLENSLVQGNYLPVGFLWNFPIWCCTSISLWCVKCRLGFPKVHFLFLSFFFLADDTRTALTRWKEILVHLAATSNPVWLVTGYLPFRMLKTRILFACECRYEPGFV